MAGADESVRRLSIKKYSNRRFYDATRSRHLTIADMHDLIRDGYDLSIVDSQTGEDITNQVLTQIILDRDPPKLEILPANILHELIRTQQQLLGNVVEQYFRQVLEAQRASQQRWAAFLEKTLGLKSLPSMNPFDWTGMFLGPGGEKTSAAGGRSRETTAGDETAGASSPARQEEGASGGDEIQALKRKLEELERRMEASSATKKRPPRRKQ